MAFREYCIFKPLCSREGKKKKKEISKEKRKKKKIARLIPCYDFAFRPILVRGPGYSKAFPRIREENFLFSIGEQQQEAWKKKRQDVSTLLSFLQLLLPFRKKEKFPPPPPLPFFFFLLQQLFSNVLNLLKFSGREFR